VQSYYIFPANSIVGNFCQLFFYCPSHNIIISSSDCYSGKVLQNSCFLTSLVKTNSMEQGLLEKLIVIYVLEQFPSFMECEG